MESEDDELKINCYLRTVQGVVSHSDSCAAAACEAATAATGNETCSFEGGLLDERRLQECDEKRNARRLIERTAAD